MNTIIKNRRININDIKCLDCERTIHAALQKVNGIKEVITDGKGVHVKYDLLKTSLEAILKTIAKSNYTPSSTLFDRIKTRIIKFTEFNERNNANSRELTCYSGLNLIPICRM